MQDGALVEWSVLNATYQATTRRKTYSLVRHRNLERRALLVCETEVELEERLHERLGAHHVVALRAQSTHLRESEQQNLASQLPSLSKK